MKTVIVFRTGTLGVWREKYNGIATYARAVEWQLKPVDARNTRPEFKPLFEYWKPDGVIIDASGNPRMFDNAKFGKIPVVLMNPETSIRGHQHPSVLSDSEEIARLAASELLELNPSSLVFIEWFDSSIAWSMARRKAMENIARMHGLQLTIISPARVDAENPARLEKRIEDALAHLPRPCGIFAVTDMIGAAAVSAASRLSMRIPDDIAVVSVDDDPEICENCVPSLSSVRPDFLQLGTSAARLLNDAMSGRCGHDVKVIVPPLRIVRRASTRSTQTYDRNVRKALETIRLGACTGITPAKIAESFGISRRMVELRFKAATGKTMGDAILDQRLSVACDFLKDGKTAISAIANFCGWKSDLAFRKVFISRFGVSPREWQKTHRATGNSLPPTSGAS
ncbi:MAG: substrate-binding domain-containing protein [Kiritimatiellae bacterium]|nr:substrate-binding domain-containing protein [Kiritimatiellia bacterium]